MTLIVAASISVATIVTKVQTPIYEAEGKLLLTKVNQASSLTGISAKVPELDSLTQQSSPLDTEAEVIRSNPILQRIIDGLHLKNKRQHPLSLAEFSKQLQVKAVRGTDILKVSYKSADAKQAAAIINLVMKLYMENNVQTNRAEATAAREFIASQLPKTEETVQKAEASLRVFKEQNQIVELGEEAKSAVSAISQLDNQLTQMRSQLSDVTARSAVLQSQLGLNVQQAVALSSLSQSDQVQQVFTEYKQTEDQLAVQRTRYRDIHPVIANLLRKQDALKTLLDQRVLTTLGTSATTVPLTTQNLRLSEIKQKLTEELVQSEATKSGLIEQTSTIKASQASLKARASGLPELQQTLHELERRAAVAESTYELLLKKLQEVQVTENQNLGNAKVVSAALVPDIPISPQQTFNLLLGGFLGTILAIAVALLQEAQDQSIHTIKEVEQLFGYPLLGTIPLLGKPDFSQQHRHRTIEVLALPVRDSPHIPISAAYNMLQANLRFLSSDHEIKIVVVTSSLPMEGKSFVSSNLAIAASANRRILVVDADMRCPYQHRIWGLTNFIGLSNVLVNQVDLKAAIKNVMPNVDVLPSGVLPPNPVGLLDSKRMVTLLEELVKTYDLIIIDTPPVVVAPDAMLLGKAADGVLMVVRPGVIDTRKAMLARGLLARSQQNILGLVVNGFNAKDESDSYYYYSSDYEAEASAPELAKNH